MRTISWSLFDMTWLIQYVNRPNVYIYIKLFFDRLQLRHARKATYCSLGLNLGFSWNRMTLLCNVGFDYKGWLNWSWNGGSCSKPEFYPSTTAALGRTEPQDLNHASSQLSTSSISLPRSPECSSERDPEGQYNSYYRSSASVTVLGPLTAKPPGYA